MALEKLKDSAKGGKEKKNHLRDDEVLALHMQNNEDHSSDDGMFSAPKKAEEGEGPWLVSYADMMTLLMGFFALIASFSKPDQQEFEKVKQATTEYFGGEYDHPYRDVEKDLRKIVKDEKLQDDVRITADGTGITMKFTGTLFFDSGGFVVKQGAEGLLTKMATTINKKSKDFAVNIEGHTDSQPINHAIIASNWELSGIRAARVAQIFENNGFQKKQLTIMGWGETKPEFSNVNPDGSPNLQNQARNRRVVIKVFKSLDK